MSSATTEFEFALTEFALTGVPAEESTEFALTGVPAEVSAEESTESTLIGVPAEESTESALITEASTDSMPTDSATTEPTPMESVITTDSAPTAPIEPAPTAPIEPASPASAAPIESAPKIAAATAVRPTAKTAASAPKTSVERQIIFDPAADRSLLANQAINDSVILGALIENLALDQRRVRQFSAAVLNVVSDMEPALLAAHIDQIIDALYRPEAQTRWECLEALSNLVAFAPDACDAAVIGTEASLYDEGSGAARLAAMRFLCAYGALDAARAAKVWPYIDEGIQCYHGDPEFQDMLISVTQFASGKIGSTIRKSLRDRMDFDAKNSKGQLGRRAAAIVEICGRK